MELCHDFDEMVDATFSPELEEKAKISGEVSRLLGDESVISELIPAVQEPGAVVVWVKRREI